MTSRGVRTHVHNVKSKMYYMSDIHRILSLTCDKNQIRNTMFILFIGY